MQGVIFDIKQFAVYDGPGIRQTVFLKGCPLKCRWCHNPEGLSVQKQLMVSKSACTDCGKCRLVCHGGKCDACGKCVEMCPMGLRQIAGREMSARELADLLLRDMDFYLSSGGGVTFSGGEPTLQADFLLETISYLRGAHTAIETCGYAKKDVFEKVIAAVDFVMMDIKHTDRDIHKEYTGVYNDIILENLELLKASGKPFVIRVPLIPGVNDTDENLESTAKLIAGAKSLERVELLPYQMTAGAKYENADMAYDPGFDESVPVRARTDIFLKYGIRSVVL